MQKLSFLPFDTLTTVWDQDSTNKIVNLLNAKHSIYLNDESFQIEAGFNKHQIQIKICLQKNDKSVVYPIEMVCVYEDHTHLKQQEIASILIDYIDIYWSEYFAEERDLFLPIDWSRYECEGVCFFLRGFVRHLKLEEAADLFLKELGHGEHEISSISSES